MVCSTVGGLLNATMNDAYHEEFNHLHVVSKKFEGHPGQGTVERFHCCARLIYFCSVKLALCWYLFMQVWKKSSCYMPTSWEPDLAAERVSEFLGFLLPCCTDNAVLECLDRRWSPVMLNFWICVW